MWFLENNIFKKLERAYSSFTPTSAQADDFLQINAKSDTLNTKGKTAIINIEGILTAKPDIFAMFFGGGNTTYEDIIDALAIAKSAKNISNIQLNIDSPGGEIAGLFETLDAIKRVGKPVVTRVGSMAASAAYAIAAQADTIIASNRASRVGSIGVVTSIKVDKDVVNITSTNAPAKSPDVTTDAGKETVVAELDAVEKLFIEEIASGRETTASDVKKNYGRGAVVLADEAKKRGMIDDVEVLQINKQTGASKMAEVELTLDDAIKNGVAQERDRVLAHLTMGEASGDMKTAVEAIREGAIMTMDLQAKYLAAGMRKSEQEKRIADNPEAIATKNVEAKTTALKVVEALEARMK